MTVGGVVVSNATLHNEGYVRGVGADGEFIREPIAEGIGADGQPILVPRDIRVGDTVTVVRAGDVIPKVMDVDLTKRPAGSQPYAFPETCPACGSRAVRAINPRTGRPDAVRRCTGGLICPAQGVERMKHFVSRNGFDIEGFGETYIEVLFEAGLVRQPADLFRLDFEELKAAIVARREALSAERRADSATAEPPKKAAKKKGEDDDKAIKNLLAAVEARRAVPMNRLLFALGIPQIGEATAKALAKRFTDMPTLIAAIQEASAAQPDRTGSNSPPSRASEAPPATGCSISASGGRRRAGQGAGAPERRPAREPPCPLRRRRRGACGDRARGGAASRGCLPGLRR